jgi:hypothetical protein
MKKVGTKMLKNSINANIHSSSRVPYDLGLSFGLGVLRFGVS